MCATYLSSTHLRYLRGTSTTPQHAVNRTNSRLHTHKFTTKSSTSTRYAPNETLRSIAPASSLRTKIHARSIRPESKLRSPSRLARVVVEVPHPTATSACLWHPSHRSARRHAQSSTRLPVRTPRSLAEGAEHLLGLTRTRTRALSHPHRQHETTHDHTRPHEASARALPVAQPPNRWARLAACHPVLSSHLAKQAKATI